MGASPHVEVPGGPGADHLLAGILDLATDAIVTVDEQHRIVHFNQGASAIFGYTAEEVSGAPLSMLIPEQLRDLHVLHMERFAQSADVSRRTTAHRQIFGRRRNGEEFPVEASISKLRVGRRVLFTAWMQDVT